MLVLDTDFLTLLEWNGAREGQPTYDRLKQMGGTLTTTVVNFEEQMRGWMGYLAKANRLAKEIEAYQFLKKHLELFCGLFILPFDSVAATKFQELKKSKIRIGTMDLKIASIVLVNDGVLATRNVSDFQKVPGLNLLKDFS